MGSTSFCPPSGTGEASPTEASSCCGARGEATEIHRLTAAWRGSRPARTARRRTALRCAFQRRRVLRSTTSLIAKHIGPVHWVVIRTAGPGRPAGRPGRLGVVGSAFPSARYEVWKRRGLGVVGDYRRPRRPASPKTGAGARDGAYPAAGDRLAAGLPPARYWSPARCAGGHHLPEAGRLAPGSRQRGYELVAVVIEARAWRGMPTGLLTRGALTDPASRPVPDHREAWRRLAATSGGGSKN